MLRSRPAGASRATLVVARLAAVLSIAYLAVGVAAHLATAPAERVDLLATPEPVLGPAMALVGAVLLGRVPRGAPGHRVLLLTALIGCAACVFAGSVGVAVHGFAASAEPAAVYRVAAWLAQWTWILAFVPFVTLLPLLFPDGRLPSRAWRPVAAAAVGLVVVMVLFAAFTDVQAQEGRPDNPLAIDALEPTVDVLGAAVFTVLPVLALAAIASLVVRFRRADPQERRQIVWVGYALAWVAAASWLSPPLFAATTLAVPLAIGVAVVRYRLFGIDVVLNRTLVGAALLASSALVYVAVVGWFGGLAGRRDSLVGFAGAVAVAAVFHPLYVRIQRGVDRLLHGSRGDPYRVLGRITEVLRDAGSPRHALGRGGLRPRGRAEAARRLRGGGAARRRAGRRVGGGTAARRPRLPAAVARRRRGHPAGRPPRGHRAPRSARRGAGRRRRRTARRGGVRPPAGHRPGAVPGPAGHRPGGGAAPDPPRPARRARPAARLGGDGPGRGGPGAREDRPAPCPWSPRRGTSCRTPSPTCAGSCTACARPPSTTWACSAALQAGGPGLLAGTDGAPDIRIEGRASCRAAGRRRGGGLPDHAGGAHQRRPARRRGAHRRPTNDGGARAGGRLVDDGAAGPTTRPGAGRRPGLDAANVPPSSAGADVAPEPGAAPGCPPSCRWEAADVTRVVIADDHPAFRARASGCCSRTAGSRSWPRPRTARRRRRRRRGDRTPTSRCSTCRCRDSTGSRPPRGGRGRRRGPGCSSSR